MPTSALVPERLDRRADDELQFAQRRRASWVALLVSRRWLVLATWAAAQWWIVPDHTGDWRYFDTAARAVFGGTLGRGRAPGGLHLYTSFPVQFGPPPILLAELARLGDGAGRAVFGIAIMCVCLPTLWLLQQTAMALGQPRAKVEATVLLGGLAIVPAWGVLAFGYTHMDDALVLFGAALALRLVPRHPLAAAVAAGTAAAAKPWGVVVLGLLAAPSARRTWAQRRWHVIAMAALVALIWWAPFLLDPRTITNAGAVQIPVAPDTPLHLLVPHAALCPLWVRPVQLLGGLGLSLWVGRRSPAAALVIGIGFRLLLDPGGYNYYWCGLLVAALAYYVLAKRGRLILIVLAWLLSRDFFAVTAPSVHAVVTAAGLLASISVAVIATAAAERPECRA